MIVARFEMTQCAKLRGGGIVERQEALKDGR
jgi:hypothetical protein